MNSKKTTLLGLSIGVIFAALVMTTVPLAEAKPNGTGQPDLVAELSGFDGSTSNAQGHAWLWFNDDENPTEISYKIVLNKIDVKDNPGKGLDELLTKVHVHFAPGGVHMPMHLFNVIGPNDDADLKIAGNTIRGNWDPSDIDEDWMHHIHHSSKPLDAVLPNGQTILEALCSGNTDFNIHTDVNGGGAIRGVIQTNSAACDSL